MSDDLRVVSEIEALPSTLGEMKLDVRLKDDVLIAADPASIP
jgi:hypothetical protein